MSGATETGDSPALDVGEVGARVEQLLERIAAVDGPSARLADDLVRSLVQLYGAGLERIVTAVRDRAPELLDEVSQDVLVAGLLSVHDLHGRSVHDRVEAALDDVRPFLGSHGGDVTLVEVTDDVVHLRLEGSCNGCGSSETTLEYAVEGAVRTAAPEIDRIEVEGVAETPTTTGGLIPLESLSSGRASDRLQCPTEVEDLAGGPPS